MVDLDAASVDDVRDFYQTYYVPENATLTIVGDFDSAQAHAARHPVPRPRAEGRQAGAARHPEGAAADARERRMTLQEPWPLPAVVVAYHITYDGDPDSYPLHIAGKVLSDGQSSRIYKKLVYEQQLAVAAFGGPNLIEDPNLFYAVAIVQPGRTPDEAADALIAEFDRLKNEPISERELQRDEKPVRARLHPRPRVGPGEGAQLAHAVVIHHDIKTADGEFDIFQSLTAADVQRVARTYFTARTAWC